MPSAEDVYLFVRNIAEEEDYALFIKQQCSARAIPDESETALLLGRSKKWALPTFVAKNVGAACEIFWMSLPSVQETLDWHTRTPVDCAFKSEANASRLRKERVESNSRAGRISNARGRLKVCLECIEEDRKRYGYAYHHRLLLMPGIDVCPAHGTIAQALCADCETKTTRSRRAPWMPDHRCRCKGPLRPIRAFSSQHMQAELGIARMAQQVLSHQFRPPPSPETLSQTLMKGCIRQGLEGRAPESILQEMLNDNLGEDYLRKVGFGLASSRRLLGFPNTGGPVIDPLMVISSVYAAFGCWKAFEETMAIPQCTYAQHSTHLVVATPFSDSPEAVETKAKKAVQNKAYFARFSEAFKERVREMSELELEALRAASRQWLASIIDEQPDISRERLAAKKRWNKFFAFITLCDSDFYDSLLPARRAVSNDEIELRVAHVHARRDFFLQEMPGMRITEALLVEGLPPRTGRKLKDKRVQTAIARCKDTTESHHAKLIPVLCRLVRSVSPECHYGDEETYHTVEKQKCNARIALAKSWLKKQSPESVIAHPYLFQERRPRD